MATSTTNAAAALGDMTRFAEMRKRLWFLLGALVVYRVGTFIPVPGIDAARFAAFFSGQQGTLLGMFNMFSGGALQRFSIFALNVMPYITASIIIQMASMVYPPWSQIRKEGESGRRKLMQYTRYGTVLLAGFQGFGAALAIQNSGGNLVPNPGPQFLFIATISITTGTIFVMWLGEQITERGIGNGITMIIVAGIIAGLSREALPEHQDVQGVQARGLQAEAGSDLPGGVHLGDAGPQQQVLGGHDRAVLLVAGDQPVLLAGGVQVVAAGAGTGLHYLVTVLGERPDRVADDLRAAEQLGQRGHVVRDLDNLVLDRVQPGHLAERSGDAGLVAAGGHERDVELAQVLADQAAGIAGRPVDDDGLAGDS